MATVRAGARFCATRCRVAWHRAGGRFPEVMTSRRSWVRADAKRPIRIDGSPASSTAPGSWSSFDEVKASVAGDGFGFMLGDGVGCYDLDDVSDGEARDLARLIPERVLFVERSVSGRGVHVFTVMERGPGSSKWAGRHGRYPAGRFIRVTGIRFAL